MAIYNTKGTKHRSRRKQYDYMYNKGFCWSDTFSEMTKSLVAEIGNLTLSNHTKTRIKENREGNRKIYRKDISVKNILAGEVVEVEFEDKLHKGKNFACLKKAVVRLPVRNDGEQVVVVCSFNQTGEVFVKTAWLNKKDDNHNTGLDTSEFDYLFGTEKFGYIRYNWHTIM